MVKKTFFISLSLFLTSIVLLVAAEFTASVNSTQVLLNDSFFLNLTLKDTLPKEAPDISILKKHFSIHSQQLSTQTATVNGKTTSNITWKVSLTPKAEGIVQIPSITVETGEGKLSSQPITLTVAKGSTGQSGVSSDGLNLITTVSNSSPYKNEPLIYRAVLTSKMPLYNVKTQKMQVDDAIVEVLEEAKLEERLMGGVLFNVVEFTYLITPLKAGSLTIPPIAIQAMVERRAEQNVSFFHDSSFAFLQGFDRLKTFNLTTDEIQLDVQAPILEVSPWLTAKAFSVEEQWPSEQTLRVGEPFLRGFLIKAEGLKASQLPHLEDSQGSAFKVYADKPEEKEKIVQGIIHSVRKEQYTLIPQQAGTWALPEISISWWDSGRMEKRTATIPERTVQILPALEAATSVFEESPSISGNTSFSDASSTLDRSRFVLYGLVGILTTLLAAALSWVYILHRKIAGLTRNLPLKPRPKVRKEKKEKLPDLNPT